MESIIKKKWMVSIEAHLGARIEQIDEEIKTIKKLARYPAIYIQFNETTQRFIQNQIASSFGREIKFKNAISNRGGLQILHVVNFVIYDYFVVNFQAKLMMMRHWNETGIIKVSHTTPEIESNHMKTLRFHARTIPQILAEQIDITEKLITEKCTKNGIILCGGYCRNNQVNIPRSLVRIIIFYFEQKENFLIINDTKKLIAEICTPNAVLLVHGYCRNYEEENNGNVPCYLIRRILGYFNITLNHLSNLLIK